jgi:flagellar hook-basal body complex protein FliE
MSSNFSINPNFQMNNFDNSIETFNKIFSENLDNSNKGVNNQNFSEIFNSIGQNEKEPFKAGAQYFVGLDSINAQKIENLSPTAQMAQDIGSGFKSSLENLNAVESKAQQDFETLASGGDISVHEVMISAQKSNLAMQMAIQLRNQMLNAYNEFKNMSI